MQPSFCLEKNIYSISVCTTSSKEDTNRCKENILKTSKSETFVLNNSSNFIKRQKPFIKEKGINLPNIVPFGHKLNYMDAAKINLSHKVEGQEVYRIHGTLSENTIGTNESSGCIRMKNEEIVELATLLEKFSKTKSFNNISVVLE